MWSVHTTVEPSVIWCYQFVYDCSCQNKYQCCCFLKLFTIYFNYQSVCKVFIASCVSLNPTPQVACKSTQLEKKTHSPIRIWCLQQLLEISKLWIERMMVLLVKLVMPYYKSSTFFSNLFWTFTTYQREILYFLLSTFIS